MQFFKKIQSYSPPLRASIYDGLLCCVMLGVGESYLSAFAVRLQASPLYVSILASVPPLLGAWSQLVGVWLLKHVESRRRIIVRTVRLQAMMWIPILILPFLSISKETALVALILCVTVYHLCGNLSAPSWNSLIGDHVPADIRGKFFGLRNSLCQGVTLLSLFTAGAMLHFFSDSIHPLYGYSVLFFIAFVSRLLSAHHLSHYEDIPQTHEADSHFSFLSFLKVSRRSNYARFVWLYALMMGAVNLSGPLIAILLLRDLAFSYPQFALIIGTQTLFMFLTMHRWGQLSDIFGNKRILAVSVFGIAANPWCWLISSNFWFLIFLHALSGVFWAGFMQASGNFLYDAVSKAKRARCTAFQATITATIVFIASLFSGYWATNLPESLHHFQGLYTPHSTLYPFFYLSGIARTIVAFLFQWGFREVREVKHTSHGRLLMDVVGIRLGSGPQVRPLGDDVSMVSRFLGERKTHSLQ